MMSLLRQAFFICLFLLLAGILNSQTWTAKDLPRFRHGNDIVLLPEYKALVVGGNESNDAITGIYRSADTAKTWDIISDSPMNPWLTSVDFVSNLRAYTCGNAGKIMKTADGGITWTTLSLTGNTASRNYKSVFFLSETLGYLAGGNRTNDSIQTILKTTNGGTSWDIQMDRPGSWLRSLYFTSDQNGIAVGDRGTVLKTSNGGTSWDPVSLINSVKTRQFNAVFFTNAQTGFIVGGNPSRDSIQTILKTTNGGASWDIIRDAVNPMLNDIYFFNSDTGYIVGDYGTILKTTDGGTNWIKEEIPAEVNDSRNLQAVHFYNRYYGAAVGESGKILLFLDSVPTGPPPPPPGEKPYLDGQSMRLVASGKVNLFATVHPNKQATTVKVHYGTTVDLGSVQNDPAVYTGADGIPFLLTLDGLNPHTRYFYKIVCSNEAGSNETPVLSFYPGYDIPNWDFEEWDTIITTGLDTWQNGGVRSRIYLNGNNSAVEMHSNSDSPGAVVYGDYKNGKFIGGVPFTGKPDSLISFVNYKLAEGDTALVLLILKKDGQAIADSIYKYAGTSSDNYERLGFKIHYLQDITPDSIIIAFTSTNFFGGSMDSTSLVTLDSIGFTGTSESVPNAGFNNWSENLHFIPKNWIPQDNQSRPNTSYTTSISTDKYNGKYSIRISNVSSGQSYYSASIRTHREFNRPSFPVNARHESLNGFVKFFPDGNDSLNFNLVMYKDGVPIGYGNSNIDSLLENFTAIRIPVYYSNEEIPDSASLMIMLGHKAIMANSYALIDALTFDAISVKVGTTLLLPAVRTFPNPVKDLLTVECQLLPESSPQLTLFDLTGRKVGQFICKDSIGNNYHFTLPVLQNGIYLGVLTDPGNTKSLSNVFKILITR